MPTLGGRAVRKPDRAEFLRIDGDYAVYRVGSGTYSFASATQPN